MNIKPILEQREVETWLEVKGIKAPTIPSYSNTAYSIGELDKQTYAVVNQTGNEQRLEDNEQEVNGLTLFLVDTIGIKKEFEAWLRDFLELPPMGAPKKKDKKKLISVRLPQYIIDKMDAQGKNMRSILIEQAINQLLD